MELTGEYKIPAPRDKVWAALNDADVLQRSMPGAESVEQTSDDTFDAVVKAKVGPVSAKFKGKVKLTNIDAPNGYTISGEGTGGAAGFGKGSADVSLTETEDGGTLLTYKGTASVGGKLAQIGQRFIDSTAAKMADEFFTNFSQEVAGERAGDGEDRPGPHPESDDIAPTDAPLLPDEEAGMNLSPWVWGPALVLVLAILVYLFS